MSKISDQVWITSKARMISERRYRAYDLMANYCLSAFSLTLIITSIYSDAMKSFFPASDKIGVAASIIVFAVSLGIYGFKFGEAASKYRECYLKLQALLIMGVDDIEMGRKYSEILEFYPNHSDRDYDDLVVEQCIKRKSPVKSPGTEQEVRPIKAMIISYYARRTVGPIAGYILPSVVLFSVIWMAAGVK